MLPAVAVVVDSSTSRSDLKIRSTSTIALWSFAAHRAATLFNTAHLFVVVLLETYLAM
eukprot:COSAG06_NODE_1052_length_10949_cov_42.211797_7_plen_58_part_00